MFILNNIYGQLCLAILIGISAIVILMMILALKQILRDVNDILDRVDKTIFILAGCQQILLLIILAFNDSILFFSALRILRIIQEVLLLNCFIKLQIENQLYILYSDRITRVSIIVFFILWIAIIFTFGIKIEYQCQQQIWLIFSGINFLISVLQLYIGSQLLCLIHSYWKDQQNQTIFDGLSKITMDELQNRQIQISIFITVSVVSASTMLFWDFYSQNSEIDYCVALADFKELIIILVLVILQYSSSSLSIYYIYYTRNRKYFNSHNWEYQKNIANFYDDRSEIPLIEM